jgi:hypothetical protein
MINFTCKHGANIVQIVENFQKRTSMRALQDS